jgi:tetratricopeptide (TPR) repeat protein
VGYPWYWYFGYRGHRWHVALGLGFSYPYYHHHYGRYYWPFYWPDPVSVVYVPYGFYCSRPTVIVDQVTVVREVEVPVEEPPAEPETPADEEKTPPKLDATTEKYLRKGSEAFEKADYETASEAFRMAVVSSPKAAPPRFAFGQALIALGDYAYASRVLREAIRMEPAILGAPGSIAGVYEDAEEYGRVFAALVAAIEKKPEDPDLLFLLLYQQHFSGDPKAVETLERFKKLYPADPTLGLMAPAVKERFKALEEFPPSKKKGQPAEKAPESPGEKSTPDSPAETPEETPEEK